MVSASVCTSSGVDAAIERDALDAERLQPADHFAHRLGGARQRHVADDDFLADDADRDRRLVGQQLRERFVEAVEGALHERMRRRVELRRRAAPRRAGARSRRRRAGARPDPSIRFPPRAAAPVRPAPLLGDLAHRAGPGAGGLLERAIGAGRAHAAQRARRGVADARGAAARPPFAAIAGCPSAPRPSDRRAPTLPSDSIVCV